MPIDINKPYDSILSLVPLLTDGELDDLRYHLNREEPKRREKESATAEVVSDLRDTGDIKGTAADTIENVLRGEASSNPADYKPWQNPGTDHSKMYTYHQTVSYKGRIWTSETRNLNSWEPGTVPSHIWRDVTDELEDANKPADEVEETPDTSVKPFKAGLQVTPGDKVSFNGHTYEVITAHTTADHWPPDAASSLFKRID